METKVVAAPWTLIELEQAFEKASCPIVLAALSRQLELYKRRFMSKEYFLDTYASGTLRKSAQFGLAINNFLRDERIAFEFGYNWGWVAATNFEAGKLIGAGDCRMVTEAVWHLGTRRSLIPTTFPEDVFELRHIETEYTGKKGKVAVKGAALVLTETSASFVGTGNVVFCLTGGTINGEEINQTSY